MTLEFNLEDYAMLTSALANRKERIQEMLRITEKYESAQISYNRELRCVEELEIKLYKEVHKDTAFAL